MCDDKKSWRMSITFKNDWCGGLTLLKFRYSEKSAKFVKKMSHHIWHPFVTLSALGSFFFQKFSGVLRISELYVVWFMVNPLLNFAAGRRGGGDGSATQRWNEFFFQAKKALHFKSRVLAWKTGCREVRLSWLRNCSNRGWEQSYTYQVL